MKDIIIIGGGPSGLTAAIYALRGGKSVLLFEGGSYGGQISQSHSVENYPGFEHISGMDFSANLHSQAQSYGCEFRSETVTGVTDGDIKKVVTDSGAYEARAVIFALGARARRSGLENEKELIGRGLSYCALCDGNFFRGRDVAVVGGGSTALHDAVYLSELCKKVYLIHRRDTFRAEEKLVQRVSAAENIELILDSVLLSAHGDPILKNITVKNKKDGNETSLAVNGLFLAIGQEPMTAGFADILPLDENGYVIAGEDCEVKDGIYVCGDCRKKAVRQLTTAVADGTVAATKALEFLQ
ncbi:MAG: FAD-dependent oxidoreductase [Oscillospiraceae bacterium]|nr:FAD-dependent oxidoreductase [Oscillospiraceae bacterium]